MKKLSQIANWLIFIFFIFAQLAVIGALYFCSVIVAHWLDMHRPGAYLMDYSIWCFKDGYAPYIGIACLIILAAIGGKIFEKNAPMACVIIPLAILLIFISIFLAAFGAVTVNWAGIADQYNWK